MSNRPRRESGAPVVRNRSAALLAAALLAACGGKGDEVAPPAASSAAPVAAASDSSAVAADTASAPELMREVFAYSGGGRDPFVSLLENASTGPEVPDLTLVAIYLDHSDPRNSVAVLRERVTGRRYSVKPGDRLGRLRVASIDLKDVTFTIDDFGIERQETLSIRKDAP